MSDTYGLTPTGFRIKRLADIRADVYDRLRAIRDPVTGEALDLPDEDDPVAQIADIFSEALATGWEQLENVARLYDPDGAVGPVQSVQVQLNGLRRRNGTASTVALTLTGTTGTVVPAGSQVAPEDQMPIFATDAAATIGADGTATVEATATAIGPTAADAGTLVSILEPVTGWTAVTNPAAAVVGTAQEPDQTLRRRRDVSTSLPAQSTTDSIFAALRAIDGVTAVRVRVNDGLASNTLGLPGKSIAAIVRGGADEEIARTLYLRTPVGIGYHGDERLFVVDEQGIDHEIQWIRPTAVPVHISVSVRRDDPDLFGADGADRIRQAIITWAAEGTEPLTGSETTFRQTGIQPGEGVSLTRLYTPINSVRGHVVTSLTIGTAANALAAADIDIGFDQIADFAAARITVNVT